MLVQFRERSSGPSAKKFILENTCLSDAFLSVNGYCENPESLSVLSEPGNGYFKGLAQGRTHCRALPFLLFWGKAEFLLSAALINSFLANISLKMTSSCWENGP